MDIAASSRLNHCNRFSHYCGSLPEESEIIDLPILATCQCGTSAMLSDIANSLVTDENTGQ